MADLENKGVFTPKTPIVVLNYITTLFYEHPCICLVLPGMSFQVTCNIFFYFIYGGWVRCWGKVWPASLMLEQHCASDGPTSCVCQICAALGRCWFSPTLDEHQLNAFCVFFLCINMLILISLYVYCCFFYLYLITCFVIITVLNSFINKNKQSESRLNYRIYIFFLILIWQSYQQSIHVVCVELEYVVSNVYVGHIRTNRAIACRDLDLRYS